MATMKLDFEGNDCSGSGTVFSFPQGADIELRARGNNLSGVENILVIRDPSDLFSYLGVPEQARELVKELVTAAMAGADKSVLEEKAKTFDVRGWLSAASSASTLVSKVIEISKSGIGERVLEMLKGKLGI